MLEFSKSQWLKSYIEFKTQRKNTSRKKWRQRWKIFVQINEQCYMQKKENRNRIENRMEMNRIEMFLQQ